MTEERQARIRQRAHEIWEAEGRPEGREAEHWAQAEAAIAAEEQPAAPKAKSRKPKADGDAAPRPRRKADAAPTAAAKPRKVKSASAE